VSRFSPGYRTTNLFEQYGRMENSLADSIAGAENLYDTRKRQDREEGFADREIKVSEGHLGERKRENEWGEVVDSYNTGIRRGVPASEQPTPQGQGSTVPNVSQLPTIEGAGTPVQQMPPLSVRGSGIYGDMNPAVSGRIDLGNGYFADTESAAQVQDRRARESEEARLAKIIAESGDWGGPGGPDKRDANARARAAGVEAQRDPRSDMMYESMLGGRSGAGAGGASATSQFNRENAYLDADAMARAMFLYFDNPGMGILGAARQAMEAGGIVDYSALAELIAAQENPDMQLAEYMAKWGITPDQAELQARGRGSQRQRGVGRNYRANLPPETYGTPRNRR
jgi:hypothetical protein